MIAVIKFFHLLSGLTFLGIIIASFFYIGRSIHQKDQALIAYSIRSSYFGDAFILACILIQIWTGLLLMQALHVSIQVPWVRISLLAFGLILVLWLLTLAIKRFYFSKKEINAQSVKIFYLSNSAIIFLFMLIVHDSVTRRTLFAFVFKN